MKIVIFFYRIEEDFSLKKFSLMQKLYLYLYFFREDLTSCHHPKLDFLIRLL